MPYYCHRKRSLGQGNIFTNVCHSFCSWMGGGGGSRLGFPTCITSHMTRGSASRGGSASRRGGLHPGGGSASWGVCIQRRSASRRGVCICGVCIQRVDRHPHWILRDTVNKRAVHILLLCNLLDIFLSLNF